MYQPVVSVIGLGYVGLPVAVAMAKKFKTIGFDINRIRIQELKTGTDRTREVSFEELAGAKITFTDSIDELKLANFHIVAVPTPINSANQPDLGPLLAASKTVGMALKPGDIVVYESTVYPGATEEDCIPVLEEQSGLKAGRDFKVGYSPERINPGDKEHSFTKIKKVVSAQDQESLERVAFVYGSVVTAGIYKADSIKVAEAAKVIENTQRDLNIAFMNELALLFDRMGIDTLSVLEAAGTKWNFLKFVPGLVGGHCIGVDPYYLTHKAEKLGYHPQVILAGRRINDGMGKHIAQKTIRAMVHADIPIKGSIVTVLGLTFKENIPDLRNTRVTDIINELRDYGVEVQICDPECDPQEAHEEYGLTLTPFNQMKAADAVIWAVGHRQFLELEAAGMKALTKPPHLVVDVKGLLDRQAANQYRLQLLRI